MGIGELRELRPQVVDDSRGPLVFTTRRSADPMGVRVAVGAVPHPTTRCLYRGCGRSTTAAGRRRHEPLQRCSKGRILFAKVSCRVVSRPFVLHRRVVVLGGWIVLLVALAATALSALPPRS